MPDLPSAHVADFCARVLNLRYIEHRPTYDLLATWLNANGGKSTDGKKLSRSKRFTAEELMPEAYLPNHARPLKFTASEAKAILAALPHLKHGSWVLQAFAARIMPLDELERSAQA